MKNLFINLFLILFSTTAFAQADCEYISETSFTCYFEGTSGLEIFKDLGENQAETNQVIGDDTMVTFLYQPQLKDYELDIDFCVSKVNYNSFEATTTCNVKARIPNAFSTARPISNKTVIKRADVR